MLVVGGRWVCLVLVTVKMLLNKNNKVLVVR